MKVQNQSGIKLLEQLNWQFMIRQQIKEIHLSSSGDIQKVHQESKQYPVGMGIFDFNQINSSNNESEEDSILERIGSYSESHRSKLPRIELISSDNRLSIDLRAKQIKRRLAGLLFLFGLLLILSTHYKWVSLNTEY